MNLYVIEAGTTHRFALGQEQAQAVYDAFTEKGIDTVTVYYLTTLTDCTHDFS